jgi:hypothetical protein
MRPADRTMTFQCKRVPVLVLNLAMLWRLVYPNVGDGQLASDQGALTSSAAPQRPQKCCPVGASLAHDGQAVTAGWVGS